MRGTAVGAIVEFTVVGFLFRVLSFCSVHV